MINRAVEIAVVFCILVVATLTRGQTREWNVSGTFVDAAGLPLPGAELTRYFLSTHGQMSAFEPLKADAGGHFAGKITPYKLPMVYLAMDKERNLGARVTLTEESVAKPLRVVLEPLAELSYRIQIENGYEPASLAASMGVSDPATVVLLSYDTGPYKLPAGEYELKFGGNEIAAWRRPVKIRAGEKLDLGLFQLSLTPIAANVGRPAMPIDFAEARGVPADFNVSDLKGKWVLIEFWGYW